MCTKGTGKQKALLDIDRNEVVMSKILEALKSRIYSDVRSILKNQGPVLGDDYKNDWICFGADINEGDGGICRMVRSMVNRMVEAYHATIIEHAYWETNDGQIELACIIAGIEKDGSKLQHEMSDYYDMFESVTTEIYEPIHVQADSDYLEFENEREYDEDDDEYNEEDQD